MQVPSMAGEMGHHSSRNSRRREARVAAGSWFSYIMSYMSSSSSNSSSSDSNSGESLEGDGAHVHNHDDNVYMYSSSWHASLRSRVHGRRAWRHAEAALVRGEDLVKFNPQNSRKDKNMPAQTPEEMYAKGYAAQQGFATENLGANLAPFARDKLRGGSSEHDRRETNATTGAGTATNMISIKSMRNTTVPDVRLNVYLFDMNGKNWDELPRTFSVLNSSANKVRKCTYWVFMRL